VDASLEHGELRCAEDEQSIGRVAGGAQAVPECRLPAAKPVGRSHDVARSDESAVYGLASVRRHGVQQAVREQCRMGAAYGVLDGCRRPLDEICARVAAVLFPVSISVRM
jgi:hypothetical protein